MINNEKINIWFRDPSRKSELFPVFFSRNSCWNSSRAFDRQSIINFSRNTLSNFSRNIFFLFFFRNSSRNTQEILLEVHLKVLEGLLHYFRDFFFQNCSNDPFRIFPGSSVNHKKILQDLFFDISPEMFQEVFIVIPAWGSSVLFGIQSEFSSIFFSEISLVFSSWIISVFFSEISTGFPTEFFSD